jgi:hypothetical protein
MAAATIRLAGRDPLGEENDSKENQRIDKNQEPKESNQDSQIQSSSGLGLTGKRHHAGKQRQRPGEAYHKGRDFARQEILISAPKRIQRERCHV